MKDKAKDISQIKEICDAMENGTSVQAADFAENIFDTIHDMEFNIINANSAAKKLLGLKILRQKCFKTYHGTDSPPERCPSCRVLKTGKPASQELFEPHLKKY